jgi:hypothetical protein
VDIPEIPDPLFKPWAAPVFSTAYYDICWFFSALMNVSLFGALLGDCGVFFLSIWVFILCSLGRRWMLGWRECVLMGVWFGRSCDVTCPVLISICVYDESVSNLWHFLHC